MRDLTDKELEAIYVRRECPFCGEKGWTKGPCGGSSMNISFGCGGRVNILNPSEWERWPDARFGQLIEAPPNTHDSPDDLVHWVIYFNPVEYPGQYIARKWLIVRGNPEPVWTDVTVTGATLDQVRGLLPAGLYPLARNVGDDPSIVETWI